MFLTIQYPIADSRAFLDTDTGVLNYPVWPDPIEDQDFVRYFGMIRTRNKGGLNGWVAEQKICDAKNAIHFDTPPIYKDIDEDFQVPFKKIFQRFYFDGLSVGKFEIGISFPRTISKEIFYRSTSKRYISRRYISKKNWPPTVASNLLNYILTSPVSIPNPANGTYQTQLGLAGPYLANLFRLSSTSTSLFSYITPENWWTVAGKPMLYLELYPSEEAISLPFWSRVVHDHAQTEYEWRLPKDSISFYVVPYGNLKIPMWKVHADQTLSTYRNLRIFLLRLHTERECLRHFLRVLATGKLAVTPYSAASDRFQYYLNSATKKISRIQSRSKHLEEPDIGEVARAIEDTFTPGERDGVLKALDNLGIRKNVFRKVDAFTNEISSKTFIIDHIGALHMGDNYEVSGQVGNIGSHGHVHDISFSQTWNQASNEIDLEQLASELSILRSKLKEEATEPEHDTAVGEIASAEVEAKKKNGPAVLEHLAKAGQWALKTATTIGVTVAAAAIKKALGL